MEKRDVFSLIEKSLPEYVDIQELINLVPLEIYSENLKAAALYALLRYKAIDWDAYLRNNPDINKKDMHPAIHFVNYGVFEGRKLIFKDPSSTINYDIPLVSIIIPNYNNEIYLKKCLKSVINQSINNIEIIVIDDCSSDNSVKIIEWYKEQDSRIKFIKFDKNQSQHMVRIEGVKNASGQYIMFLDSDDFYAPNACEIASNAMRAGYDIVAFKTAIVNTGRADKSTLAGIERFLNSTKAGYYQGKDLLELAFKSGKISHTIWDKIYRSEVCKKSFAQLEYGYFPKAQDLYQFFVLAANANSFYAIDDKIYYYNYGIGVSNPLSSDKRVKSFFFAGDLLKPIARYCVKYDLKKWFNVIRYELLHNALSRWLKYIPAHLVSTYFKVISRQYGIDCLFNNLIDLFFMEWKEIAKQVEFFSTEIVRSIKSIGIYYHRISIGGAQIITMQLCELLINNGYHVVIFLEEKTTNDLTLNPAVKVIYIHPAKFTKQDMKRHCCTLHHAILQNQIDVMLYQAGSSAALLWDLLLLRLYNIPTIGTLHESFSHIYIYPELNYNAGARDAVFRCLDKLICLSPWSELYFRIVGVDAIYIPNPVKQQIYPIRSSKNSSIAVIGRFSDKIKQIYDCLNILVETIKIVRDIKMILIGDFNSEQELDNFINKAKELGVMDHIRITGWTDCPGCYLAQCSILLSTSYTEGFPLAIAEAQSIGLPCVIYDVPIHIAENNDGIICVNQHDTYAASQSIVKLLLDNSYWQKCSKAGIRAASRYNTQLYEKNILFLLNYFSDYSLYKNYDKYDYLKIINTISFYSEPFSNVQ